MTKTIVIILLIISISFFTWYFIINKETFPPCINCHLTSEKETIDEIQETNNDDKVYEQMKTPLNFEDFRETQIQTNDLESILKSPEEQKSFIPTQKFTGQKDGYVFKNGRHGNGYYLDKRVRFNL